MDFIKANEWHFLGGTLFSTAFGSFFKVFNWGIVWTNGDDESSERRESELIYSQNSSPLAFFMFSLSIKFSVYLTQDKYVISIRSLSNKGFTTLFLFAISSSVRVCYDDLGFSLFILLTFLKKLAKWL